MTDGGCQNMTFQSAVCCITPALYDSLKCSVVTLSYPKINQSDRCFHCTYIHETENMITRGNLSRPRAFSVTSSLNKIIVFYKATLLCRLC